MRTVISVSLTIIVLVFVLTWFTAPAKLEVPGVSGGTTGTGNATANATTQLHPFVKTLFDVYAVVIAFYFASSAAESVAKTLKPKEEPKPKPPGGGGSPESSDARADASPRVRQA